MFFENCLPKIQDNSDIFWHDLPLTQGNNFSQGSFSFLHHWCASPHWSASSLEGLFLLGPPPPSESCHQGVQTVYQMVVRLLTEWNFQQFRELPHHDFSGSRPCFVTCNMGASHWPSAGMSGFCPFIFILILSTGSPLKAHGSPVIFLPS